MTRRRTYGESMADWERENDERQWLQSLYLAKKNMNYLRLEELVKEGVEEEYSFPSFDDPKYLELLDKYLS